MARPGLEVADIFRAHGPAWRTANAGHVSLAQLKVMSAIERCRTAAHTDKNTHRHKHTHTQKHTHTKTHTYKKHRHKRTRT